MSRFDLWAHCVNSSSRSTHSYTAISYDMVAVNMCVCVSVCVGCVFKYEIDGLDGRATGGFAAIVPALSDIARDDHTFHLRVSSNAGPRCRAELKMLIPRRRRCRAFRFRMIAERLVRLGYGACVAAADKCLRRESLYLMAGSQEKRDVCMLHMSIHLAQWWLCEMFANLFPSA